MQLMMMLEDRHGQLIALNGMAKTLGLMRRQSKICDCRPLEINNKVIDLASSLGCKVSKLSLPPSSCLVGRNLTILHSSPSWRGFLYTRRQPVRTKTGRFHSLFRFRSRCQSFSLFFFLSFFGPFILPAGGVSYACLSVCHCLCLPLSLSFPPFFLPSFLTSVPSSFLSFPLPSVPPTHSLHSLRPSFPFSLLPSLLPFLPLTCFNRPLRS